MNIIFEKTNRNIQTQPGTLAEPASHHSLNPSREIHTNGFALDISGAVTDNGAYAGHGRTTEELMQEAGAQDLTARRNYMAVMSNSMSDKDFAKLQREGFHPGSCEVETVVTIVDHIKAALVKGGVEVAGYTDTLTGDKLEEITGSAAFAAALKKEFDRLDLPMQEENVQAVTEAFRSLEGLDDLTDGSKKYMIENDLDITPENLYLANYAGTDADRQGQGYYAAGNMAGYYAKKPETIDYEQLMPQMKKVIEAAGFPIEEATIRDAKWLIEKGIPLNEETFGKLEQLGELKLPVGREDFAKTAAIAVADGREPVRGDLLKTKSDLEYAVELEEKVRELTGEDADYLTVRGGRYTLRALFEIHAKGPQTPKEEAEDLNPVFKGDSLELARGRRMLEEVRLSMSISANLKLLKSGFQIETAPMEELIDRLKEAEEAVSKALTGEEDTVQAVRKRTLFDRTVQIVDSIKEAPVRLAARISSKDTLPVIEEKGKALAGEYKRAGEAYETLMTAPRKDMGDSIKKAFRNVDDILQDMQKEITESNRRTVRILGYNSMDMTEENFERIRSSQMALEKALDRLKPGTVLSMIREGINPLQMSLGELNIYLDTKEVPAEEEMESYGRFLYQLEKKKDISEEERSAYIGIHRLLYQIEKGDEASLGAVIKSGAEETLSNLLSAVRSGKKGSMDYRVDDAFGGVAARSEKGLSITEQIEKGFFQTARELEEAIESETEANIREEYEQEQFQAFREAFQKEDAVLQQLMSYEQPVSADHLNAMEEMLKGSAKTMKQLKQLTERDEPEEEGKEKDLTDKLGGKEELQKQYEEWADEKQVQLQKEIFDRTERFADVREMTEVYKQLGFMKSMARAESFVIPVEINGELTAINLKMLHKDGEEAKVSISMETELFGTCIAEFTDTKNGLSGYSLSSKEGGRLLEENKDLLKNLLKEDDINSGDIRFIAGERVHLEEYAGRIGKDRIPGQTPDTLYKAARAYINFVREVGRKGTGEV